VCLLHAGNAGGLDFPDSGTVGSPALGKNVLAVGSHSNWVASTGDAVSLNMLDSNGEQVSHTFEGQVG